MNSQQKQIQDAVTEWQQHRDLSKAGRILELMQPYITGYVRKRYGVDEEELEQEARMGVLRALEAYEVGKAPFTTYASYWMFSKINKAVTKASLINYGRGPNHSKTFYHYNRLFFEIRGSQPQLTINETHKLMAEILDVPLSAVQARFYEKRTTVNLGSPRGNASFSESTFDDLTWNDVLTNTEDYEDDLNKKLDYELVIEYLKSLVSEFKPIEQDLLQNRILATGKPDTLDVIAKRNEVTKQRVEQIEKPLLKAIHKKAALFLKGC